MAIVRIVSPRQVTWDIYNQVQRKIDEEGPPDGLIVHTAVDNDGRPKIIDIWESEEHAQRFGEQRLGPAIMEIAGEQVGGPPEPDQVEIYEIKAMMKPS
jgi:hypothetical protein